MRETSVAWRPDGSEVVFSRETDIRAVSQDGRELRTLAQVWPVDAEPTPLGTQTTFSFASSGPILIYATCEFVSSAGMSALHELALLDVDNPAAEPRRLTSNVVLDYYPEWSPDGQRVAYARGQPNEAHAAGLFESEREVKPASLYVMAADGTGKRSMRGGEALIGPPRWSPDGRWLAFLSDDGDAGLGLHVVSADGTVRRRLSDAGSEVSWAPDSGRLAFIRYDGQFGALWTITLQADDAAERQLVARFQSDVSGFTDRAKREKSTSLPLVSWSPSGDYIVYECQHRQLCIVGPGKDHFDRVQFYGDAVAWSPDGLRLAVVIGDDAGRHQSIMRPTESIPLPGLGGDNLVRVYTVARDGSDLRPLVRMQKDDYSLVAAAAA